MIKVGLTGGIGSGKSTVAKVFESLGIPIFYADIEGKKLLNNSKVIRTKIITAFGTQSYQNDGTLNKTFIAQKVFGEPEKLKILNHFVHPEVSTQFEIFCAQHLKSPYVIEEAAILIEAKAYLNMNVLIGVRSPIELRMQRVCLRDQMEIKDINQRIQSQLNDEQRSEFIDYWIENNNTELVIPQVLKVHLEILKRC